MKNISVILSLVAVLFITKIAIAQNKINLPLGQKIHQNTKQMMTITQTVQGNDMEIKTNLTWDVDIEVKSVVSDFELSSTITRIQTHNEVMGNSSDFDH